MPAPDFDTAVVIGRFQPVHRGHALLLRTALACAARVVVVLGSAHRARDARNPFTWEERAAMLRLTLSEEERARVTLLPVRDAYDDARWQAAVTAGVAATGPAGRVALVGCHKDASSYYLNLFPDWTLVGVTRTDEVDATGVRRALFTMRDPEARDALLRGLVHPAVADYLRGWMAQGWAVALCAEHDAVQRARALWADAPYPPVFVTVDAVVRAHGHVLLVERGGDIGRGLWALPGGFIEPDERLLHAAIRELREETGLGLLDLTLAHALRGVAVFDHPARSQRGRTLTHAHFFDLGPTRLPEVAGADDAARALWVPVTELPALETRFFEDHYAILNHFLQLDA